MLALIELPEFVTQLHEHAQTLSARVATGLESVGEKCVAKAGTDLLCQEEWSYVYIRDGLFRFACNGKVTRLYSAGDFVLGGQAHQLPGCTLVCSDGAGVTRFERSRVAECLSGDPELLATWLDLQDTESRLMDAIVALQSRDDIQPAVGFENFEEDQLILTEGTRCDLIFELISGDASVYVKGVEVAQVKEGEIFGEMSFLTGEPCAATVIAQTPCMVQTIPKSEFERMIRSRPHLMVTLARTLAQRVSEQNSKLVDR